MSTEPEALRLADALDAEFVQGRISNSTGRESAIELRRLALKQWVGLTTGEMKEIADRYHLKPPNIPVAFRAIEAKLREKNKW
jgi:hypothetical protein